MIFWGIAFLIVNLVLAGSLLFIVFFRKDARHSNGMVHELIINELRDELTDLRETASRLDAKAADLEKRSKAIDERQAAIEGMMKEKPSRAASAIVMEKQEDVYSKAVKMFRSGVPSNEIKKSLGLLTGEAELLSSLNRL